MFEILYKLSDATIFILMSLSTIAFSLLFIVMNRIFKFYNLKYSDNTTTASIASLLGIVYGVLAGFLCLYLLNNQDQASNAAVDEGSAAFNIYHESKSLKQDYQESIQKSLKSYILNTINYEWPMMALGKWPDKNNDIFIGKMADQLIDYPIVNYSDAIVIYNIKQQINTLYKARQYRMSLINSQLSPGIWYVIILSTGLIIIINYAFRVNFKLHIFSLTAFSLMAASVLFLLVTLDRPFTGEFVIEPNVLRAVLDQMNQDGK